MLSPSAQLRFLYNVLSVTLSFHTKPSRPQLSSQAAESASHRIALHFLTLLGEEGEAHRMKVTRMKCSLGQMPNSCR